jgi:hypothetical protein
MLIEPASKVSVLPTVVMRTRSNTPLSAREPADADEVAVPTVLDKVPACTHVFPEILVKTKLPNILKVAAIDDAPTKINPDVAELVTALVAYVAVV